MNTNRIDAKAALATAALESVQGEALKLAQAGNTSADDWARYANRVAEAEGAAHAWIRIRMTVDYLLREGHEVTAAALLDTITEVLSAGADDGWSGRVNDSRRARFDGIRRACTEAKYIVTD